jgi:bifunctional enzyme CysN/CysC
VRPTGFIPISAREGDGIAERSRAMRWYQGPTVLEALDQFVPGTPPVDLPLRLPIQDVYKFDQRRILVGRIASGRLAVGDELVFSPSNKTAKVRSIEGWSVPELPGAAGAGQSVGITLEDQIFVERGEIASHREQAPIESNVFRARVFWLGRAPLEPGNRYTLKLNTTETDVTVQSIASVIDTGDLSSRPAELLERNGVAEVVLRTRGLLALDEHRANPLTGRFVLVEDHLPVGGGIISMEGYPDQRELITRRATNITTVGHGVALEARIARNGHKGGVLWLTGLSGSGKSTLALALEAGLFAKGYHVYVLDGDNIRDGLNANLGFSPADRAENIRRVGEVAALFADAGFLVITSFISPYRADRERARRAAPEAFHEIYIDAPLEVCEARDPKGLYKRARAGEIPEFTGVSSPYEPPEAPELAIHTGERSVEDCLSELMAYVEREFMAER